MQDLYSQLEAIRQANHRVRGRVTTAQKEWMGRVEDLLDHVIEDLSKLHSALADSDQARRRTAAAELLNTTDHLGSK